jgi:hypothetical protein
MTVPNDPLKRAWVEVAPVNPDLVAQFRPALLCILAVAPGRSYQIVGTGFVIAANSEFALAITAKHVLVDGVARIQRPRQIHAPSAPLVAPSLPSIESEKLRVVWMGDKHADMLTMVHAGFNETTDLACCIVVPQPNVTHPFLATSIPLDMGVPRIGDVIHMISHAGLTLDEIDPPIDPSGKGQSLRVSKSVSIRIGTVTGVYPGGLRQYRWPCFTTSIPAEPGTSGGFTYLPREGQTIAACGVVCADNSSQEARANQMLPGESIVGSAWPAIGLRCPEIIPSEPENSTSSLYSLMRSGRIDMAIGGLDHIRVVKNGLGDCTIIRLDR